jgi:hypothetical protein
LPLQSMTMLFEVQSFLRNQAATAVRKGNSLFSVAKGRCPVFLKHVTFRNWMVWMYGSCKAAPLAPPPCLPMLHPFGPSLFVKSAASKSKQVLASQLIGQALQYTWYNIKRNTRRKWV